MSVGASIKKRRFELNMSQQELADAMGYKTRSTIAKIESGENDVTQKRLAKFAEVLDTTVEALMGISTPAPLTTSYTTISSDKRNKAVAIILAGGKSIRNHKNIPNQFININGKPVIVCCLEAYQHHPAIDDIYVVCLKGWGNIVTAYAEQFGITKLRGLIPAAASGILSVENGLDYVKDKYADDDIIIFQESTRPMVNVEMISKLLQACYENGKANICQSMKDYVQFRYKDGKAEYINREDVVDLQSPEAYRFDVIKSVFEDAKQQHHSLTESCCAMLMFNLGYDINFIEGSVNNIKIIRDEDIAIFGALLKRMD
ncbi:MAG: 2-C-methyl-D-erythritol 4-phosphate cytidylyltransferase [Lachnospira sp.]